MLSLSSGRLMRSGSRKRAISPQRMCLSFADKTEDDDLTYNNNNNLYYYKRNTKYDSNPPT